MKIQLNYQKICFGKKKLIGQRVFTLGPMAQATLAYLIQSEIPVKEMVTVLRDGINHPIESQ